MTYIQLPLKQLGSLSDGELIHVTGIYTRNLDGAVLTAGDLRLQLVGMPFSYIPKQMEKAEIWGRFIKGKPLRLQVHDSCPFGAAAPVPQISKPGNLGDEIVINAHVRFIGDDQVAVTSDHHVYMLIGEELDQRHYIIRGHVISTNPPILEILQAVPFRQTFQKRKSQLNSENR